jgi:amidase
LTDWCALPATEIAARVRSGAADPVQVVRAHLDRIDQLDADLHAFQAVRREEALADAAALAATQDLPLAGVPVAVKDNVDVAGLPTRFGSAATSARPKEADDELVRRLRAAGAIVVGKTQLPELAIWPVTEPAAYPATRNPLDRNRTPGGSTGGGAVAVATGMAAVALGSDGGGSLRIPAACCGVVGLKPTPGLVPVAGGAEQHWLGLSAYGPLARTVADVRLMLSVLADAPVDDPPVDRLRVAWSVRHPLPATRISPAVRAAVEAAARLLEADGHTVVHEDPPYPADLGPRFLFRWLAGIAEDAAGLPEAALEPKTRAMARRGRQLRRRARPVTGDAFARRMAHWFTDRDVLLMPTLSRGPVSLGAWKRRGWFATALSSGRWICTTPWNVAGVPALSVPFGTDPDGLPIGLQLVAAPGAEGRLLAVAARLQAG